LDREPYTGRCSRQRIFAPDDYAGEEAMQIAFMGPLVLSAQFGLADDEGMPNADLGRVEIMDHVILAGESCNV
jgi:hypothetical protein